LACRTSAIYDKEAVAEYEKAVELSGGNAYSIAFLVFSLYLSGQKKRADGLFEGLKKRAEKEYVPATSFYLITWFRKEEDLCPGMGLTGLSGREIPSFYGSGQARY
jgi:hypothetical protein